LGPKLVNIQPQRPLRVQLHVLVRGSENVSTECAVYAVDSTPQMAQGCTVVGVWPEHRGQGLPRVAFFADAQVGEKGGSLAQTKLEAASIALDARRTEQD
jgi:hypothetical protein